MRPRNKDRGTGEEDGERAGSEEWADEAAGSTRDTRRSGVVRRAAVCRAPARQTTVRCTTLHDAVEAHADFVWSILMGAGVESEAEAIRQDVFVHMLEHLQKNEMPDDVQAMLARITWRRINDHWREQAKKRARASSVELELLPASSRRSPEALLHNERLRRTAEAILGAMRPEDAELLKTYDRDDMSHEEAAAALGIPVADFRRRLANARARFSALAQPFKPNEQGEGR